MSLDLCKHAYSEIKNNATHLRINRDPDGRWYAPKQETSWHRRSLNSHSSAGLKSIGFVLWANTVVSDQLLDLRAIVDGDAGCVDGGCGLFGGGDGVIEVEELLKESFLSEKP